MPSRLKHPFFTHRPFAPRSLPASPLLWPRPTPRFAFAIARPPKFLTELSRRVVLLCPAAPARPNRIGHEVLTSHIETCWSRGFRVNETLRRKFTCIAAYFFVRQDSRTSVADYASLRLCRPTASIRLCTARPPNRMSISLRFSSFQLIVHAELRLAYLYQYYSINKL